MLVQRQNHSHRRSLRRHRQILRSKIIQSYVQIIAFSAALLMMGCKPSSRLPKPANIPYAKIELGMSFDDAKAFVEGDGEKREYDKLPVVPKPRDIYSKLPTTTEWHVWTIKSKPTLILGVVGGKIAFKQVVWSQDGERRGDANALPQYQ
jgi:hypothetical protein